MDSISIDRGNSEHLLYVRMILAGKTGLLQRSLTITVVKFYFRISSEIPGARVNSTRVKLLPIYEAHISGVHLLTLSSVYGLASSFS